MATDRGPRAEYFAGVVAEETTADSDGAYPAFVAYAGARAYPMRQSAVTEIANSLLGFGAERVLILDTGISTLAPVEAAITVHPSHPAFESLRRPAIRGNGEGVAAAYGSHADEIETSLMLAIAPGSVDMSRACFCPLAWRPSARTALAERPEFAQLFAERQLRRSDAGLGREGQDNSHGHRGLDGGGGLIGRISLA